MPEIKLLPCPFCGDAATTKISYDPMPFDQIVFVVYCRYCNIKQCYSTSKGNSFDDVKEAMSKAIELWNRRTENETD